MGKLCFVLSETGMSFDDIKSHTASAVAKSGGATYKNFFSIHDGFYKCDKMTSSLNISETIPT
ncbi:hypothetical protein C1645_833072 [Glomus cerebriforme]|uniref:Uncharacterized protein n=1 Tax=Glomus cerebriforme TaxID=658196 RepID=A0A397SD58_9GLOM|nr:hypothetical protein C1645_833072 [Glomus cerebriforme]